MLDVKTKTETDLAILKITVQNTSALISQLSSSSVPAKSDPSTIEINVLNLAYDTASLIRAHATKISLLIINEPFTASAVTKVLHELVAGPLPGLASAVQLCVASKYTNVMSIELQHRARRIFTDFNTLVETIPLDGQILGEGAKNGTIKGKGKGSLAITGTVWEACDAVIELKSLGIAGLMIAKVDGYQALLKDALEELQEWAAEESDDDDVDNDEHGDSGADDAQAAVDEMFSSQKHIPTDDPEELRPRLDSALKRLRLLSLMYQAVVKRRFKTLPALPYQGAPVKFDGGSETGLDIMKTLEMAMEKLKSIPDDIDELANSFYELDRVAIDQNMDRCFLTGSAATELMINDWVGQKDEFSAWATKFQAAMKKGW